MSEMAALICKSKATPSEVSASIHRRKVSIKVGLVVVVKDISIG